MRRRVAVTAGVLTALVLTGCSADADVAPAPAPPAASGADGSEICAGYGDVWSILENADIALSEGRMDAQEHLGWYQLAERVLDRLPSDGDDAVHTALAAMQEVSPGVTPGKGLGQAAARAPEWYDVGDPLGAACDELGTPVAITMLTGG